MTRLLTAAALAALLSAGLAPAANAWERHGTVYGPRGTSHVDAYGGCYGNTCGRSVTRTGPYGGQVNRQGNVTCTGGTCYGNHLVTGPNGGQISRQGQMSCEGGTCTGSRTTTGPNGGTVYREGSISRY